MTQVALVASPAGLGDHGFNDAGARALEACRRETNVRFTTAAPKAGADTEAQIVLFATEKFDTVIGVGYAAAPAMARVARRFEDGHFAIIDAIVAEPNVESVTFDEAQGAFLAGALAASVSASHRVAFVGGADVALIQRSEAGFIAGVREADPHVSVTTKYIGTFEDEAAGRAAVEPLLAAGNDVVFVLAGRAGLGAIAAIAAHAHAFAIGADIDQSALAPGRVLTSVVKGVDAAVLRICRDTVAGKMQSGHHVLGLADDGIGLAPYPAGDVVAPATQARIERIRAAIIAGKIQVPGTRAALATFVPVPLP